MTDLRLTYWFRVGLFAVAFFAVGVSNTRAGIINVVGDTGDGTVDVNGLPQDFLLTQLRVGVGGNDVRGLADVFFFALPNVPSPASILGAQLNFEYLGISQFSVLVTPEFNADLFGLGARTTPTILGSDYYDGNAALSTNTLLAKGLITPSTVAGSLQISGSSLLNFVTSLYKPDGTPIAAYAVFRANADVHLPAHSNPYRGYELASADDADASFRPRLNLTVAETPVPSTLIMSSILFGMFAVVWAFKRLRQTAAADGAQARVRR